ncbi:hypothetical protein JCM11251_001021 [Rhodosporidiobolus azoricus]
MTPNTTVLAARPAGNEVDKPSNNASPTWWKDRGLRSLNLHCGVLMLGSFVCGFDGSIMNSFFGLDTFLRDMGNPDANQQGLLTAGISLGYLIGFLPASYLSDRFGRRWPQILGAAIVCLAVVLQVTVLGGWEFFGWRILLGFGAAFPLTAGAAHLFELVHPRQAATMATLFGACYWTGSVTASWSTFGFSYMEASGNNWSWRAPALLQGLASLVQLCALYWVPESPRWLVAQGRMEDARAILAKYHANGDEEDELIVAEVAEIETAIKLEKETAGFGYLDFFKTKGNRYRLFLVVWIGFMTQVKLTLSPLSEEDVKKRWSVSGAWDGTGCGQKQKSGTSRDMLTSSSPEQFLGNTLISYYLLPILDTLGVVETASQQGINGGLQVFNLVTAVTASVFIDRFSRRFTWLFSTVGVLICFSIITVTSAVYDKNTSVHAGRATIAFIFLYSALYNISWSIQFYSYVLEILPYGQRTKGMAVCLLVDYAALFFAQYANPPAFNAMGWKYYTIYIAIIAVNVVVVYLYFPETAGLTLEQSAALLDGSDANARLSEAAKTAVEAEGGKKDDELSV